MGGGSHHKRRRHLRREKDGSIIPVRETTVRNHKGDNVTQNPSSTFASSEPLRELATEDRFDADDVVFAFEYPEWSSKGFRRSDAAEWMRFGIDPDNAAVWSEAGYQAGLANEWRLSPNGALIPAVYSLAFIENDVPRQTAVHFWSTQISVGEAVRWHSMGVAPHQAVTWRNLQITCDVTMEAEDRGAFRRVTVTVTSRENPSDSHTYDLRFSHTGAFQQASSNVRRKTRVVKTKAEFLRLHFPGSGNGSK